MMVGTCDMIYQQFIITTVSLRSTSYYVIVIPSIIPSFSGPAGRLLTLVLSCHPLMPPPVAVLWTTCNKRSMLVNVLPDRRRGGECCETNGKDSSTNQTLTSLLFRSGKTFDVMIPYYNERSALARSEAAIIMNHDDVEACRGCCT
jgi:hypothetical protein